MMNVKLVQQVGNASVVVYVEDGIPQARVVSSKELPADASVGDEFDLDESVLEYGTYFGMDWQLLVDQTLDDKLQSALRNHGIWTLEDFISNPTLVRDAIGTVVAGIHVELQKRVQQEMK